jgi:hypothetical protein
MVKPVWATAGEGLGDGDGTGEARFSPGLGDGSAAAGLGLGEVDAAVAPGVGDGVWPWQAVIRSKQASKSSAFFRTEYANASSKRKSYEARRRASASA